MSERIVVTGPDGAGKTTLIEELRKTPLGAAMGTLSIWDPLTRIKGLSKADVSLYLSGLNEKARVLFLLHAWEEGMKSVQADPRPVLIDSYWFKYYVTELLHDPNNPYLELFTRLPSPDLVFYLEEPAETLAQRKKDSLSPYEALNGDLGRFLDRQERATAHWNQLKTEKWVTLPSTTPLRQKVGMILDRLRTEDRSLGL